MARIVIFDEAMRGVDLPREPVILGRSKKADIPIRDSLLSRKHCTIVPHGSGLRLLDLKSSNGTFLNGNRIERSELKSEDVIEIGNTVIVLLLEDGRWSRREGPPRLRNPAKANELIETLKKRGIVPGNGSPPSRRGKLRSRMKRKLTAAEAAFMERMKEEILRGPAARALFQSYIEKQIVSLLVKNSSQIRRSLRSALERVLEQDALDGGLEGLRERIGAALDEVFSPRPETAPDEGGDTPRTPSEEEPA